MLGADPDHCCAVSCRNLEKLLSSAYFASLQTSLSPGIFSIHFLGTHQLQKFTERKGKL